MNATASIRCGHCASTHRTVAEVRECAGREYTAEADAAAERAAERHYEERNSYEVDDIERALWALEDERRAAHEAAS